jgi:hypothetical protein
LGQIWGGKRYTKETEKSAISNKKAKEKNYHKLHKYRGKKKTIYSQSPR